ncbi:hypothetical protein HYFRA_00013007 [Hymenoscyphus fraxineus]|uniref:Uncharacterized protein n=1 Tax=Hymenoscyphus fraxineus TaxID=746836 RepID=A0A9N9L470_9HELO|nr:hypothetical protein HYFRA_00013007 [Hymenoscyphus fraxineus]
MLHCVSSPGIRLKRVIYNTNGFTVREKRADDEVGSGESASKKLKIGGSSHVPPFTLFLSTAPKQKLSGDMKLAIKIKGVYNKMSSDLKIAFTHMSLDDFSKSFRASQAEEAAPGDPKGKGKEVLRQSPEEAVLELS